MVKPNQFLLALCLFCLLAATSPRPAAAAPAGQTTIPAAYELVGENENFQLYANPASLGFKVVDKRSEYVWSSTLDEKAEEDRLNKTWTAFAASGISIDYLDIQAVNERASITNSENTLDYQQIDQGFEANITFVDPAISLLLRVKLEKDGVSVELPFDSVKEDSPDFKLGQVYVYPFMGATRGGSTPGYMFIPDGSGSLINFSDTTKAANMFYARYYGADLGMISELPWDPRLNRPYRISIPVTGMVHGPKENAFIAIVEKGASYGEIQAHPAGIITNFNFISNTFIYNQSYFQATNRSGAGVTTLQQSTNAFDVLIQYRFLTGEDADYVGMARSYQQYLLEKGALQQAVPGGQDIGIRLEFLGGEKERVLLWNRAIPMTTIDQMAAILSELKISNPEVVYFGWQPGGASSMPPGSLKIDSHLGTLALLNTVIDQVTAGGGRFSLYLDPQAALWDEKGYSARSDLAMSITNNNLIGYNRYKLNYYLNLEALREHITPLSEAVLSQTQAGLALDTIGSTLYSDFKKGHFANRESTIQAYQDLLQSSSGHAAFYQPNDYMFAHTTAYYDIPLDNSGYTYFSEIVPFLQVVFAGHIPYYGTALNFSPNIRTDLLKHADFGVYPAFFLTQEVTAKILNTSSTWIYTSSYAQWRQEIEESYAWLNAILAPVKGHAIVARQALAEGIFATSYSNGKTVVVNYTDRPYQTGAINAGARDAVLIETSELTP